MSLSHDETLAESSNHPLLSDEQIHLVGATVQGFLSFDGARLATTSADRIVLDADGIRVVEDSALFRAGFVAIGEIRMRNAHIGRELTFEGGIVRNPGNRALELDHTVIGEKGAGPLLFVRDDRLDQDFIGEGAFSLEHVTVNGDIVFRGARLAPGSSLTLARAPRVGQLSWWQCAIVEPTFVLDLRDARIDGLADQPQCWPAPGRLLLDGLRYQRFVQTTSDATTRLAWVRLQPSVSRGPYDTLAKALETAGDSRGATLVRVAREHDLRAKRALLPRAWNWVLEWSSGYGEDLKRLLRVAAIALGGLADRWLRRPSVFIAYASADTAFAEKLNGTCGGPGSSRGGRPTTLRPGQG